MCWCLVHTGGTLLVNIRLEASLVTHSLPLLDTGALVAYVANPGACFSSHVPHPAAVSGKGAAAIAAPQE
jgi:hypothetical protein